MRIRFHISFKFLFARLMLVWCFLILFIGNVFAQTNTVGSLLNTDASYDGYILFSPAGNTSIYLIDNKGRLMHQWVSAYFPGNAVYLMPDGMLYRAGKIDSDYLNAGGAGGIIEKFNWDDQVVWSYTMADENSRAHHDFQVMPNGNVLILYWELKSKADVIANGRNPEILSEEALWPEAIVEINPFGEQGGEVVWEWHAWDHLIQEFDSEKSNYGMISDYPGKIDLNYIKEGKGGADWHHANSLDYNVDLDQIMLSVLNFDEVWVIDHHTTTEEAKGEKGDLIYRWGNPMTYGFGEEKDKALFGQHNAHWIKPGLPDEGKIMIFNNGRDRPAGAYSSIVKIAPSYHGGYYERNTSGSFLPESIAYEYIAEIPSDFYSWYISGVQQLSNGHLLINAGAHGTFFEIDKNENVVWKYVNPVIRNQIVIQGESTESPDGSPLNGVFRATKYDRSYPAFEDKNLVPGSYIELYPLIASGFDTTDARFYPNPAVDKIWLKNIAKGSQIQIINMSGQVLLEQIITSAEVNLDNLPVGIYQVLLNNVSLGKLILY